MLHRRNASAGGVHKLPATSETRQHSTFSRWALLSLGILLPWRIFAGELDFRVTGIDNPPVFQQFEGFQLAPMAQTSEVNIRLNKLEERIKRHTHPMSHHFLYLIRGQIELTVGDETRLIGAGDFVAIPRGTPHAMRRIGTAEALFLEVASPPDIGDVIWHE
jgi:quercetin dioxygenase-like cupin family protein